jgi:hypothetical protein
MRPLPVLPLPILIAHLQRPTRSLISLDSVSVSDVTSNCIKKEEAIAKFALDPKVLLDKSKTEERGAHRNARRHPMRLVQDSLRIPQPL